MKFGDKLKEARKQAGLKQSELAEMLGTTNKTISNWENGVSKPDLDTLSYICGALNVSATFFLKPIVPEEEYSHKEKTIIKKYRVIDDHGKGLVDVVLDTEYERCTSSPVVYLNAAHQRTDVELSGTSHDDDIMDDDSEWE